MEEILKRVHIPTGWGLLRDGWYVIECGGLALDDPGPAAVGYVLRYPNGRTERRRKMLPGVRTQDDAEFEAVFRGLQFARRRGAHKVTIQTASDLVIRQLKGAVAAGPGGWRSIWKAIERLLQNGFDAYLSCPIPGKQNRDVYALAQRSLDRALGEGVRGGRDY